MSSLRGAIIPSSVHFAFALCYPHVAPEGRQAVALPLRGNKGLRFALARRAKTTTWLLFPSGLLLPFVAPSFTPSGFAPLGQRTAKQSNDEQRAKQRRQRAKLYVALPSGGEQQLCCCPLRGANQRGKTEGVQQRARCNLVPRGQSLEQPEGKNNTPSGQTGGK